MAGTVSAGCQDGPAQMATFGRFLEIAADGQGGIYVADTSNCKIRKIFNGKQYKERRKRENLSRC